jgi:hypothetical protein
MAVFDQTAEVAPGSLCFQDVPDDLLVLLFVALFEADLRVPNDAPGVNDVRRSAKGVSFAQVRTVSEEDGVRDSELLVEFQQFPSVGQHGNHEHLQAVFAVTLVELLEMNHLLSGEGSVSREKADRRFGVGDLPVIAAKREPSVVAGQCDGFAGHH